MPTFIFLKMKGATTLKKNSIVNRLYMLAEWIMYLAYLNLIWLLFTLLGLIVFGCAPATAALFAVWTKVSEEKTFKVSLFKSFFEAYKRYFMRANFVGYSLAIVVALLIFGFINLPGLPTVVFFFLSLILGGVGSIVLVVLFYSFPVLVNYNTSYVETFKMAFIIGLSHLNHAIIMGLFLLIISFALNISPGFMVFFLISLPAYIISKYTQKSFIQINNSTEKDSVFDGQE